MEMMIVRRLLPTKWMTDDETKDDGKDEGMIVMNDGNDMTKKMLECRFSTDDDNATSLSGGRNTRHHRFTSGR